MVRLSGVEPLTSGATNLRSNQLELQPHTGRRHVVVSAGHIRTLPSFCKCFVSPILSSEHSIRKWLPGSTGSRAARAGQAKPGACGARFGIATGLGWIRRSS